MTRARGHKSGGPARRMIDKHFHSAAVFLTEISSTRRLMYCAAALPRRCSPLSFFLARSINLAAALAPSGRDELARTHGSFRRFRLVVRETRRSALCRIPGRRYAPLSRAHATIAGTTSRAALAMPLTGFFADVCIRM